MSEQKPTPEGRELFKFNGNVDELNQFMKKRPMNGGPVNLKIRGEAVVKDKDGNVKSVLKLSNEDM